jgi:hypothetical protein
MHKYEAYGLIIHSELILPELIPSVESSPDVVIRIGSLNSSIANVSDDGTHFVLTPQLSWLYWEAVGTFRIRGGREIVIDPIPETTEEIIRLPLLGTVIAVLLHQRGDLVLHGSAVAIQDHAVVFVGNKGKGKSTMAAALYRRGYPLIADDVVAIRFDIDDQKPYLSPGFPQMKLWPESAKQLGSSFADFSPIYPDADKLACRAEKQFITASSPLRRIYVLEQDETPSIRPLPHQAAFIELIRHSYLARFGNDLTRLQEATERHFMQCMQLVNHVDICQLKRRLSLDELPDVARMIENDLLVSAPCFDISDVVMSATAL